MMINIIILIISVYFIVKSIRERIKEKKEEDFDKYDKY